MRRFEFVGDGSEKFWEVERDGTAVTVRFGRLGTNGQSRTKDLATQAAASAHLDKLVAEKTGKGYVETPTPAAATPAVPPAATPAVPPQGTPAVPPAATPAVPPAATPAATPQGTPAVPPAATPAATPQGTPAVPPAVTPAVPPAATPAVPPAATPAATPAVPPQGTPAPGPPPLASDVGDETTFVVPAAWERQAEPFRGRRPVPEVRLDPRVVRARAAELWRQQQDAVRRVLSHPSSDAALADRALIYLDGTPGHRQDDPVGPAVAVAVLCTSLFWTGRELAALAADDLVLGHGAAVSAEVGARMAGVEVVTRHSQAGLEQWVVAAGSAGPGGFGAGVLEPVLTRLRRHLADAADDTYAEAVQRLSELRHGPWAVRVVTSYLAPTEQHWVEEDVADLPTLTPGALHWPMLLASVTTRSQAEVVLAVTSPWALSRRSSLLYTVAANLGTEAAGPLAALLDRDVDAATTKRLLGLIAALPSDEAFGALADRIDRKLVPAALVEMAGRYPARALRLLATRASGPDIKARSCRQLLRGHLLSHPGLADRLAPELDAPSRRVVESVTAASAGVPEAAAEALPALLVTPPWESRKRAAEPAVVPGLQPPPGLTLRWEPGEQQEWAQVVVGPRWARPEARDWPAAVAAALDPDSRAQYEALDILAAAPPEVVRPHLARFVPRYTWDALPALRRILGGVGEEAAAFTVRTVVTRPTTLAPALLPIEGAAVASLMAEWLVRSKSLRPLARSWLDRHPQAAARDLVPAALAKLGRDRTAAEAALRALDRAGHRQAVREAAASYGDEALVAIDATIDADPLERPTRAPALPSWLVPAHLPPVLLAGREAVLPVSAVAHVCTVLALCQPGEPYAGVEVVKAATDPAALAEMAWGLFERWQGAGFPSKDGWVLEALGLVGDDETVRRLAPLVRAWPGEGGHARAVAGLEVLASIGSDLALTHLHAIAEKARFKGLRNKARQKMDEVADGLGLSADQLADRLVPDFGLDQDGTMVLDYGPRRFTVGFDEQLKPLVADEDGSPRKLLPRPSANDDQALASAAYAAFGALKRDVKSVAADQVRRFERAMVMGRRWTAREQRALFVQHPLLWHLSRRLVWATFDARDQVTGSFRVAEDRTLADVSDTEVFVDGDAAVGIAHPLQIAGQRAAWSELFSDYEILQPFPQLGRDTWELTPAEREAKVLARVSGLIVETGRVLGLAHRGWDRGPVMDGGVSAIVQKPVRGGAVAVIDLDPGIVVGSPMEWKQQRVTGVWLSAGLAEWPNPDGDRPFSVLDDIAASELVRDLEHLRG